MVCTLTWNITWHFRVKKWTYDSRNQQFFNFNPLFSLDVGFSRHFLAISSHQNYELMKSQLWRGYSNVDSEGSACLQRCQKKPYGRAITFLKSLYQNITCQRISFQMVKPDLDSELFMKNCLFFFCLLLVICTLLQHHRLKSKFRWVWRWVKTFQRRVFFKNHICSVLIQCYSVLIECFKENLY